MNEPYCGNCGANLIDMGVVEVGTATTLSSVAFRDHQKDYIENSVDWNSEVFESVDCSCCGHPLNESQTDEYRNMEVY